MPSRVALSIHTKVETNQKLEALARDTNRTKSALVNEALEQYLAHQEWLTRKITDGVSAADRGELIDDQDVEAWFQLIGAAN